MSAATAAAHRLDRGGMRGARDVGLAAGAGQQSLMADAMKPLGQDVEQEAPDERAGAERHCAVSRLPVAAVNLGDSMSSVTCFSRLSTR
jgi:hypothetical protein